MAKAVTAVGLQAGLGGFTIGLRMAGIDAHQTWEPEGPAGDLAVLACGLNRWPRPSRDLSSTTSGRIAYGMPYGAPEDWARSVAGFPVVLAWCPGAVDDVRGALEAQGFATETAKAKAWQVGSPSLRSVAFVAGVRHGSVPPQPALPRRQEDVGVPVHVKPWLWDLYEVPPSPGYVSTAEGRPVDGHWWSPSDQSLARLVTPANVGWTSRAYRTPSDPESGLPLWAEAPRSWRGTGQPMRLREFEPAPAWNGRPLIHPVMARPLTGREAARLMGYPDDWGLPTLRPGRIMRGPPSLVARWAGRWLRDLVG